TPTGLPDWTNRVSSDSIERSDSTMRWNASQLRAAFPAPPYTTRSSHRSATSGSRLFMSMRSAASCGHPLQEIAVPRGARIGSRGRPVGGLSFTGVLYQREDLHGPSAPDQVLVPGA